MAGMVIFTSLEVRALVRLMVIVFMALGAPAATANAAPDLTGADLNFLIRSTLAAKGINAEPRLNADRPFLKCDKSIQVESMFGGWQTVRVKCTDSWQIMVRTGVKPTQFNASSRNPSLSGIAPVVTPIATSKATEKTDFITVMALSRSMSRGEMVTPDDVVPMQVEAHKVSGIFFNATDVIGRKLKRNVSARKPIKAYHLRPRWLVEEDDEVTIQSEGGAIKVAMVGLALENGQFGDWVKVQNMSSGLIVSGKITGVKKITIRPKMR